jgi:uncharacterized protein YbaA (DUF1428 family)
MTYVEGFVVPVPKKKLAAYRAMAKKVGKVFMDHGALTYVECIADDVKVGKRTSFPRSVKLKSGETVALAWITFKSRAARDRILDQVRKDKRSAAMMNPAAFPFDGKRMIFGGFKSFLEL